MSFIVGENLREPWSKITNTRILRPGDELKLIGAGATALIGVLDAHDPSARIEPNLLQQIGLQDPPLPAHHHVLAQLEGGSEVLSTGLFVGEGNPEELLFPHVSPLQFDDEEHIAGLRRLHRIVLPGNHGLYYVSAHEQLSSTPMGRTYLDDQGRLLR